MLTPAFPDVFSSTVTGLGAPVRYFPIRKLNKIGSLVAFIILLGGAVAVLLYGLYVAYAAYQQHGLAVIWDKLMAPGIIAFVLFLCALLAGWSAYKNWNREIVLYEKGFAIRSRKGIQSWPWSDMVSIKIKVTRHYTNGIYSGTTHEYTLMNRQNEKLRLNDAFSKVEELAASIEQSFFPLIYEPAAKEYNNGHPLEFGPVAISKTGMYFGKKTIPWVDIKEVSLQKGELKISRKGGGWFSGARIPAPAIPNLRVLLTIISQVVGLKTG